MTASLAAALAGLASLAAGMTALAGMAGPARADEARPLALRVGPSGFEPEPGSLAERIARRDREAAALFRSICRGCGRHGGLADDERGPFDPQASLAGAKAR